MDISISFPSKDSITFFNLIRFLVIEPFFTVVTIVIYTTHLLFFIIGAGFVKVTLGQLTSSPPAITTLLP